MYNPIRYAETCLPEEYSFLTLDNPQVKVTALKKCEDDNSLIVRLYICSGQEEVVHLQMPFQTKAIVHTNLIEEELESVQEIRLGKYAIETYKIKLE